MAEAESVPKNILRGDVFNALIISSGVGWLDRNDGGGDDVLRDVDVDGSSMDFPPSSVPVVVAVGICVDIGSLLLILLVLSSWFDMLIDVHPSNILCAPIVLETNARQKVFGLNIAIKVTNKRYSFVGDIVRGWIMMLQSMW